MSTPGAPGTFCEGKSTNANVTEYKSNGWWFDWGWETVQGSGGSAINCPRISYYNTPMNPFPNVNFVWGPLSDNALKCDNNTGPITVPSTEQGKYDTTGFCVVTKDEMANMGAQQFSGEVPSGKTFRVFYGGPTYFVAQTVTGPATLTQDSFGLTANWNCPNNNCNGNTFWYVDKTTTTAGTTPAGTPPGTTAGTTPAGTTAGTTASTNPADTSAATVDTTQPAISVTTDLPQLQVNLKPDEQIAIGVVVPILLIAICGLGVYFYNKQTGSMSFGKRRYGYR